jgi:hypothetical protein
MGCLAAQLACGAFVFAMDFQLMQKIRFDYLHAPKRMPFYGIWTVDEFSQDGIIYPLSLDDRVRWTRFAFDGDRGAGIQWSDGSVIHVSMKVDISNRSIALSRNLDDPDWLAQFRYENPAPDILILHGAVKGHAVSATMRHSNMQFRLTSEGIRIIQYGMDNR